MFIKDDDQKIDVAILITTMNASYPLTAELLHEFFLDYFPDDDARSEL